MRMDLLHVFEWIVVSLNAAFSEKLDLHHYVHTGWDIRYAIDNMPKGIAGHNFGEVGQYLQSAVERHQIPTNIRRPLHE